MQLNDLPKIAHAQAVKSGWWIEEKPPLEIHMLIVSEIAEATEAARKDHPPVYLDGNKPEGEAVELADAVIRIADYFGHRGWDLEQIIRQKMDYNATRPFRHGGKRY